MTRKHRLPLAGVFLCHDGTKNSVAEVLPTVINLKKPELKMTEKEELKEQEINPQKEQEVSTEDALHDDAAESPEGNTDENKPDTTEEEKDPLEEIQKELSDLKDQNLRLYAEFENFRKRTARERVELFSTANQELMDALLPVIDDFRRAMKAQEGNENIEGFHLIYNKLENTLKNKGLKPMDDTTGKEFNVDTMEAITRIPAPDKKMKGKVIDEIERGYLLGNKILRYAKVVVGE